MKSTFESADHQAIQKVKAPLAQEAITLLNGDLSGRISSNMQQLAQGNDIGGDLLIRLIQGELTGSERKTIREIAGLREPTTPAEEFFFPKKK